MSEPDSPSRRRPPTIDLTAQEVKPEVKPEQARSSTDTAGTASQKSARWNFGGPIALPIAALAGAVVTVAIIAALWAAGIIPPSRAPEPQRAEKPAPDVSAQLNKIESELQKRAAAPDPALLARLATLEAQTKTLGDSIAAPNKRLDDIAVAAKQTAQNAQAAAQSAIARSDLDALQTRIAALERQITAVGNAAAQQRPASTDDRAARAALAAAALRDAVECGAPFATELAAVKALGTSQSAIPPLEACAARGVPSVAALTHDRAQLTPALQHAPGTPPAKTSFL